MKIKDIDASKLTIGNIFDLAVETNIPIRILESYFILKSSLNNGLDLAGLIRCIENTEVKNENKYN